MRKTTDVKTCGPSDGSTATTGTKTVRARTPVQVDIIRLRNRAYLRCDECKKLKNIERDTGVWIFVHQNGSYTVGSCCKGEKGSLAKQALIHSLCFACGKDVPARRPSVYVSHPSFAFVTDYQPCSDRCLKEICRWTGNEPRYHRRCSLCGSRDLVKRCSGCNTAYYCGKRCQKKDWKRHRPLCDWLSGKTDVFPPKDCSPHCVM